jgi:thiopurine S-methyltransferase
MKHDFWHQKWQANQIGFHLPEANALLVKHFGALNLKPHTADKAGARVFLPLCGKTLDIAWLLAQGYRVVGAELSAIAIDDLFASLNLTPSISKIGDITQYSAPNIEVFVGDIFKVTPAMLGHVDAVYDRAALVALPDEMRKQYSVHMLALTNRVPQLLVCFVYEQSAHDGPPFSVNADEVKQHYQADYALTLLEISKVIGGLKGVCPATEHVWLLTPLPQPY